MLIYKIYISHIEEQSTLIRYKYFLYFYINFTLIYQESLIFNPKHQSGFLSFCSLPPEGAITQPPAAFNVALKKNREFSYVNKLAFQKQNNSKIKCIFLKSVFQKLVSGTYKINEIDISALLWLV